VLGGYHMILCVVITGKSQNVCRDEMQKKKRKTCPDPTAKPAAHVKNQIIAIVKLVVKYVLRSVPVGAAAQGLSHPANVQPPDPLVRLPQL
jgi:hypothetical protein